MSLLNKWILIFCGVCSLSASAEGVQRSAFEKMLIGSEALQALSDRPYWLADRQCVSFGGEHLTKGYAYFLDKCMGQFLLRFVERDAKWSAGGNEVFFVRDAVLLPLLHEGEHIIPPGQCQSDGKSDADFLAIANFTGGVSGKVREAWHFNTQTGVIEELHIEHTFCRRRPE